MYLTRVPTLSSVFSHTSQVNSALTDNLNCFTWGGLAVAVVMDLEYDAYKQIEVVASDSLDSISRDSAG